MVYSDWNSNGVQDPEDQPLENIPIRLLHLGNTTTSRDGEFAFLSIPIGLQQVGIDLLNGGPPLTSPPSTWIGLTGLGGFSVPSKDKDPAQDETNDPQPG